jgi:hypothetical protein
MEALSLALRKQMQLEMLAMLRFQPTTFYLLMVEDSIVVPLD